MKEKKIKESGGASEKEDKKEKKMINAPRRLAATTKTLPTILAWSRKKKKG